VEYGREKRTQSDSKEEKVGIGTLVILRREENIKARPPPPPEERSE